MSNRPHSKGLRAVAIFEASKGVLSTAAFVGLAAYLWHPVGRPPQLVSKLLGRVSHDTLRLVTFCALIYALMRFIEAFGLWNGKRWAEWFAVISGTVFLPFELYEIVRRPHPAMYVIFTVNVLIVAYVAWLLYLARRERALAAQVG